MKDKDPEKSGASEDFGSGQSGDAGPAVVSSLSSTALETSRAVKAADQPSDQNGAGRADEKDMSEKSDKLRQTLDVII